MPRITLNVDKDVIQQARQLAKERGVSMSALFSQFVEGVSRRADSPKDHGSANESLGPITRKAMGLIKLPANKSSRTLIEEAILEKYKL